MGDWVDKRDTRNTRETRATVGRGETRETGYRGDKENMKRGNGYWGDRGD